jgi:hypothetical protein
MEQLAGAGVVSIVVLGYLLLLEALTAAVVLLGQFLVLQIRALRSLVEPRSPIPAPVIEPAPELPPDHQVVVGGGIKKWD